MTPRSRILALSLAALMVTTTLVSFAPAATAQDAVPTRPGVTFTVVPNIQQSFYLRYQSVGAGPANTNQPDCTTTDTFRLELDPAQGGTQFGGRAACTFAADGTEVDFVTTDLTPYRPVTITGNLTSLIYHHSGTVPQGTIVSVFVRSGSTTIANGSFVGDSSNSYTVPLRLRDTGESTGVVTLQKGQPIHVAVRADAASAIPGLPSTYALSDVGSRLEMRADNAIRAATWITDERSELRTVFSPIANDSQRPGDADRRLVGHFALESAFGYEDASRGDPALFRIYYNGQPRQVLPGGGTVLTGALNQSASAPSNGTAVWSFPAGTYNYRGSPGGEYTLRVEKEHHQGVGIGFGIEKTFSITAQGVDLRTFTDAGVSETQAHSLLAGSSTTYLLQISNTGAVNDTFTINMTAPNAPAGWGATIGGPDVQARRVFVPAGETRVFTVTVNAPSGATGQIIHLVNVTSTVDSGVRSRDLTLVSTISNEIVREVGIVFLARNLEIEPGVETHYQVYLWNRGTRPANITLELKENTVATWTADLAFGNANVDRLVVSGIQPGDIGEATLKITGTSAADPTHAITLNATSADISGVSTQRAVTFSLRLTSGVTLRVLDAIGGQEHVAELQAPTTVDTGVPSPAGGNTQVPNNACTQPPNSPSYEDCTPDGIDGLWYRIWVTNNGRRTERFDLTSELFDNNCANGDATAFFEPGGTRPAALGFYHRNAAGTPSSGASSMNLEPGETGEVYFLMPVNRNAGACDGNFPSEIMTFVVQARGDSGAVARQQLKAIATNGGGTEAVYIEPIARLDYSSSRPIVDTANATKRSIGGAIRPGGEVYYYVRVTNAASWGNWTQADGDRVTSDLRLTIDGVNVDDGWNVSMRPVEGDLASEQMREERNPFRKEFNLTNIEPGTNLLRAWIDKEIQVRVQAPSVANGTAVTDASDTFTLFATVNDSAARNTLEVVTTVSDFAQVNLRTDVQRVYAHAGDATAFLLYLNNTGGSGTRVTMRASMAQTQLQGWNVEPNAQTFALEAFKNRTMALRVTPPANAAPGSTAVVNITVSYIEFPKLGTNVTRNVTLPVTVEVVGPGTLQLTTPRTEDTIAPGGTSNFTMTLRNTGSLSVPFRVTASPIPNWSVTASPEFGNLSPGDSRTVVLVAIAPNDVTNDSSFSSVLRVEDVSSTAAGTQNFDTAAFTINILGGRAIPSINVPNLVKRVDRDGSQSFEVQIRNVGTAAGRIPLEWRALDPTWPVSVRDARNNTISSITLAPNELANVYVNVSAPFNVPERTVVPVEIVAYTPDLTQAAKATLTAEIHDYGVQLVLVPSSKDGLPGQATEFVARLRNTGNDNDTLNLSVNLVDLPEWSVDLAATEVRLEPNQETEIRATFRSPTDPLPTPRAYTFPVWVGTRGGQEVNLSKNMTQSAVITIPNYRAYDMDGDTQLEVAVDLDKRAANGFEEFREIFNDGTASRALAKPVFDGRTTFLLDVPEPSAAPDGLADIWFNPETVHAFTIEHAPDVNGDGTPDYLLDTDRDGKIDRVYDTVTGQFWSAVEVKVFDDDRIQYLVDTTGDGRPDRFYDPETKLVTRTQAAENLGSDYVGIDVDDDKTVDYYYNTRTQETSGAEVQNIGGFAQKYWYFFVAFLALVVVTVLLIVRRRRTG